MRSSLITEKPRISKKFCTVVSAACIVILVLMVVIGPIVVKKGIEDGANAFAESFHDSYVVSKEEAVKNAMDKAKAFVDEHFHVSNQVEISVNNIQAEQKLEVFKVSDVVYVVTENDNSTVSWLQVQGSGTFTVDLSMAEYVVDNIHQYVLVRVPKPALESKDIAIDSWKSLLFRENKWNVFRSASSGEGLARDQLAEAQSQIQNHFLENESYFKMAESMAISMIQRLVSSANVNAPDIQVEVEFY